MLPSTVLIGRSFSSSTVFGLPFRSTSYSVVPIFAVPPGRIRFCCADRVDDVGRRQALGLQRLRIEVDLDLRLLAAVRIRNLRALHGRQLRAQEVHAEVEQLLLGQRLARQRELQHRHARRVVTSG